VNSNIMRRAALPAALALTLGLTACGGTNEENSGTAPSGGAN